LIELLVEQYDTMYPYINNRSHARR